MYRLLAILLLFQPAPILLGATFTSSTSAAITWQQPADPPGLTVTCLIRDYGAEYGAGICWNDLASGAQRVDLPGALRHPAYRPAWHDVYILQINGVEVGRTTLGETPSSYSVYLPLALKHDAPEPKPERVYLPVVGR